MNSAEIFPETAAMLLDKGEALLVDVRNPAEFSSLHAAPAMTIPLEQLDRAEIDALVQGKKLCIICQNGTQGVLAVEGLRKFGFQAENVVGGTCAWRAAGLPVVVGRQSVSVERQVRVCAGILTVLGSLASFFQSSEFIAVPLFIGCGLIFTGATGWCGLGLLFARAPWNNPPARAEIAATTCRIN